MLASVSSPGRPRHGRADRSGAGGLPGAAPPRGWRPSLAALALVLALSPTLGAAGRSEFFVLWSGAGRWNCTLTMQGGRFDRIEPYLFWDRGDRIEQADGQRVTCSTLLHGGTAGLHLIADGGPGASVRLESNRATCTLNLQDIPERGVKIIPLGSGPDCLIFGRGDPGLGPPTRAGEPAVFKPPAPRNPIALPPDWWRTGGAVRIKLSTGSAAGLAVRRVSRGDGTLYLEICAPGKALRGTADVALGTRPVGSAALDGALWLSLAPRIGDIAISLECPDGVLRLNVPTTLVEVRGRRLFLNGEPYLIKGTLPGSLSPGDARYIKSLGMNTIRGFQAGNTLREAARYGFMVIASIQGGGLGKLSTYAGPEGAARLARDLPRYLRAERDNGRAAAASPYTLVIQLDNERTTLGANPLDPAVSSLGADPWSEFLRGDQSQFARLDGILARDWNLVKPMAPMLPLGYANESQGYLAPAYLDVVMHNSYLAGDRYGVPLKEFMRWQGCARRPFINSEYGANRYTPEAYHGAKNSPVLEKLQAWGYRQAWKAFMAAGTIGGTSYRLFDLGEGAVPDQGTHNFGIMTADHRPKLACWELWRLWRDFEVAPNGSEAPALRVTLRRDYWARDCRLAIRSDGKEWDVALPDVPPHGQLIVPLPSAIGHFQWRIDFTTHGGLPMVATGAYPRSFEADLFLDRLKGRPTFDFLKVLLDARVLTAQGLPAPATLADMERSDTVVPVAFRCPDGVVYLTAFARAKPGRRLYLRADLATSFKGKVTAVDEWTGKPVPTKVRWEATAAGITLRDVAVPLIPGPIGQRSDRPLSLPVFRITPF
jgi:hypothetical protein